MSEPYLGQVIAVGFNFAPVGWALCQGQVLPISEYSALYQLLGTTYGGNGQTNFALPDLRGRAALGMGQGSGLQPYIQGQLGGVESVTLTAGQFASHTHALQAAGTATTPTPALGSFSARPPPRRRFMPPPGRPPHLRAARSRSPQAATSHMRTGSPA